MPFFNDRRCEPRHSVEVEVTFVSEHNFFTGLTQDLSGGGLFVATAAVRPIGEKIRVRFTIPTHDEVIEAITEVRWVRTAALSGGGGEAGMGLCFLQLAPRAKQAIKAFLKRRESLLFDTE